MNNSLILNLLKNSINASDFHKKLEDTIENLESNLLPESHVKDKAEMVKTFEGYESFFHATQESLSQIAGNNPEMGLKSTHGEYLLNLREDRDRFCELSSELKKEISRNDDRIRDIESLKSALSRGKDIVSKLDRIFDEPTDARTIPSFEALKWIGFKVFKLVFVGKLTISEAPTFGSLFKGNK